VAVVALNRDVVDKASVDVVTLVLTVAAVPLEVVAQAHQVQHECDKYSTNITLDTRHPSSSLCQFFNRFIADVSYSQNISDTVLLSDGTLYST
jgi:hypothetical protein